MGATLPGILHGIQQKGPHAMMGFDEAEDTDGITKQVMLEYLNVFAVELCAP
jgi:hypothetical protein